MRLRLAPRLAAIAIAVVVGAGGSAFALPYVAPGAGVDQSNPVRTTPCRYSGWEPDFVDNWAAQTFTAGVNGYLTDVVLPLRGRVTQIVVRITSVDAAGAPVLANPLASITTPFAQASAYGDVTVSFATPPKIEAGKQYAIVVSGVNQNVYENRDIIWRYDGGSSLRDTNGTQCLDGAYPGGRAWGTGIDIPGADADFFFQTYVVPARHLTVQKSGAGRGTVQDSTNALDCGSTCSAEFRAGQSVVLTATPDAQSMLVGLSGGGCSGSAPTCSLTVNGDMTVVATFAQKPAILTVRHTGMGSVASRPSGITCGTRCRHAFAPGKVSLTAAAAAGWRFLRWLGACRGTKPSCGLTLSAASAEAVTAVFGRKPKPRK